MGRQGCRRSQGWTLIAVGPPSVSSWEPYRIVRPRGKTVGLLGKTLLPPCSAIRPSIPGTGPKGKSVGPARPVTFPSGNAAASSGRIIRPQGKFIQHAGRIVRPKGRIVQKDGNPPRLRSARSENSSALHQEGKRKAGRDGPPSRPCRYVDCQRARARQAEIPEERAEGLDATDLAHYKLWVTKRHPCRFGEMEATCPASVSREEM